MRSFTEKEAALFCSDPAAAAAGGGGGGGGSDDPNKPYSATNSSANLWIMKPVGLSRGRGISLVSDIRYIMHEAHSHPHTLRRS